MSGFRSKGTLIALSAAAAVARPSRAPAHAADPVKIDQASYWDCYSTPDTD
ncbi:hypothetical protein ACH4TV_47240 [Streptomyces sp. NPDC020898]|uniref:hypothetical protein n=1 Tax=Streptomyces sp. NPDC020898 TaxID=3365101 RepID=UPI00379E6B81